jgi:hypothetical protein
MVQLPPRSPGGRHSAEPSAATVTFLHPPAPGHRLYCLADVAGPLGLGHFAIRTIIEKLRLLAEHDGMPLPRTPRFVDGRQLQGPFAIHAHSRWDAGEFDAWLHGRHPGAPAVAANAVRFEMAQRAERMAAGR